MKFLSECESGSHTSMLLISLFLFHRLIQKHYNRYPLPNFHVSILVHANNVRFLCFR
jgi:hypothetical protein